jgi:DNA-binding PadR family transcriptional regulator
MTAIKRDPAPYLPLTPAAFHVLLALADGPKHGYLIMKDVEDRTGGGVRLGTGTLYGLIKRFLDDELIVELPPGSPPRVSQRGGVATAEDEGSERRRPYKLTPFGRQLARAEAVRLEQLVSAARTARLLPERG